MSGRSHARGDGPVVIGDSDPDLTEIRAAVLDANALVIEAYEARVALAAPGMPVVSLTNLDTLARLEDAAREAWVRLKRREKELARVRNKRTQQSEPGDRTWRTSAGKSSARRTASRS